MERLQNIAELLGQDPQGFGLKQIEDVLRERARSQESTAVAPNEEMASAANDDKAKKMDDKDTDKKDQ